MPRLPHSLLSYLRVVAGAWRDDPREDAELLALFADSGDEIAFKALVCRHGPLVWRSCTRVLGNGPDAEDAFQVAFLALARKAGRLRRESLAGWLHRVARQAALKVDLEAKRRQNLEHRLQAIAPSAATNIAHAELYAALDEELVDLPEQLRVPLLLHYLEGKSQVEVARLLGCARSVVQYRLARGEAILRKRLERRGMSVSVVSVGAFLGSTVTAPAVPTRLIGSTARAAVAFRSGVLTGGAAEAARAVLGAFPSSLGTTIMRKSLWIVLACVCSLGVGLAAWQAPGIRPDAAGSPESAASPNAVAEPDSGQVDRYGDPLPVGAMARLGTVRLRHVGTALLPATAGANSMVFSRDGKVLITAGPNNTIRVWEVATGKLLRSFGNSGRQFPNSIDSIILSPDGNTLAARAGNGIDLWEVATGKHLHKLINVRGGIHTEGFSRDGRTLLSTGSDNLLRVWDVATGKALRDQPLMNPLTKAERAGQWVSIFSPDGKTLASISSNDKVVVHLWEATTGKKLHHLSLGKGEIPQRGIAFSPDSRFLAVSSNWHDEAVHLLEVATGKEVRKWMPDKTGTFSVAFSPDGKVLVTGSGFGPIRLWETATGKELRQCQGYRAHVVALAFSPDSNTLASLAGLNDHTARLWEVASGKELTPPSRGHVGPIVSLAFSADGKSLISGGRDGLVGFWNAETGQEQRPPLRAGDFQALAALAPDGKTFLTVSNNFSLNVYEGLPSPSEVVRKTPSLVCVWDRVTGQKLREFKGFVGAPQSLTLSPDGKILLLTSWDRVYLIEITTGKTIRGFTDIPGQPKCAALSPDGKILAVYLSEVGGAGGNATVYFYETVTGKELGSIQAHGTEGTPPRWYGTRPYCLAFSPDGQTFALGGMIDDKEGNYPIRLWRTQKGKKDWKQTEKFVGHQAEIWRLTFSPDGKTLASASQDGALRLWEVATGKERRHFAGHSGEALCLAFAPDGRRLAAGGDDTTILVWDVTGRLQNGQLRSANLSAREVKSLWADLASADAARAGQAVWTLAAAPAQALPLLREQLRPVAPAGPRIVRLIADLNSDTFAVRQKAMDELEKLGEEAEPALRRALAKSASLEMRRRLEQLLEPLEKMFPLSGEKLRTHRALEVLGQIGTPETLPLLEALAQGASEARLTLEAQAILKRLRTRMNATKP